MCLCFYYTACTLLGQDEIFDMVKPGHPAYITLADLKRSGVGHTVVSILTDVNGFWAYEHRENMK